MKYVYPAIFELEPDTTNTYNVSFPDLPSCYTFGEGLHNAIEMATDVLNLWLFDLEERHVDILSPSDLTKMKTDKNIVTLISADTEKYKRQISNRSVKKTLTIPSWLNEQAEDANINFSQLLQKAIKTELGISE